VDRQHFIAACRKGGRAFEQALRQLHQDYGGALLNEATRSLGQWEAARDLVQDTLFKAWRACAGYRGESELFPWLKRILRHGAIDQLRRRQPEQALDDEQGRLTPEVEEALQGLRGDALPAPETELQRRQAQACFQRCAARFAEEQPLAAQVMNWIAEDDLSPAEIAELLGRSPGATREFISQCRKKARLYFADWYRLVASTPTAESLP